MDVFDLVASLRLDSSDYDKGLSDSKKSADDAGNAFDASGKKAIGWGAKVKGAAKVGAVAIAAVSAATVAFGTALTKAVKSTADYGDNVDKMSQKIGISAESYQKWDYVMKRAGTSVDNLKMGMKTLSQQAEKNSDSFQKLGISQEEVASLSQEELFERTIKGLAGMEAGTERAALATELLGRAGVDMGPLLNQGSAAIEEQMDMAVKYGMVMPDAAVSASAAFEDSLTTMQMTMTGLKNRMMGEFLPAFTQVTDGLALLFTGDLSGIDSIEAGINEILSTVGEMMPTVLEAGGRILEALAMGIIENLPTVATMAIDILTRLVETLTSNVGMLLNSAIQIILALVTGITQNLPTLIPAVIDAIITISEALIDNIDLIVDAGIQLVVGLANGLIKALPKLINKAPTLIRSLASALIRNAGKILSTGIDLIAKLAEGIGKGFVSLLSKVGGLARRIPTAIKSGIGSLLSIGKDAIEGLWNGIKEKFTGMLDKVKGLADKLPGVVKKILGIASPSKVFMEVGKWIPEGLALGIEKNMHVVYDAADAMAGATSFTTENGANGSGRTESFAETVGEIVGDRIADALDGLDVVLDRRSFGKMARRAVNAI